jgi:uncharacterized protein YyaL (SSP411 family)
MAGPANHLAGEKSPYLIQHSRNPVDWYPWGEEAINKARRENKVIFLSIGYSSCHWCHVQAHESFEDPKIAKLLNDNYVSIKVDREERPDIDEVYMKSVVAMTGSGGWPLSVFLTPKLEPFYGGTYFPPVSSGGMPAFSTVLESISRAWKSDKKKIADSAAQMKLALTEMYKTEGTKGEISEDVLDDAFASLCISFDEQNGGFGSAPKFPMPSNLFFLLRYFKRTGKNAGLQMVTKTLQKMASGGVYDQLGGGFHRYSTDRFWLVPHFEKMLYDNALLASAYTEGYLVTKDENFRKIATETLDWTLSEMTDPEGGFWSAKDADSPEGEGAYYVWSKKEIVEELRKSSQSDREAEIFCSYYSVTEEGNFERGKSILTSRKDPIALSKEFGLDLQELERIISITKSRLLEARSKRRPPLTDDKIISSWNGLMISAMSKAYSAFGMKRYMDAANRSANFILAKLCAKDENGRLRVLRRYRDGEAKGLGILDDYSFFINGLLDLYEASFEKTRIESAIALCESMISLFHDDESGGFFLSSQEGTAELIARPKEIHDGAIPSGNSMAALALLRLYNFTEKEEFREKAKSAIAASSRGMRSQPQSFTHMLVALDYYFGPTKEIVLSGDLSQTDTKRLLGAIRETYVPNSIIALATTDASTLIPGTEGRISIPGESKAKVYVCNNKVCKLPVSDVRQLREQLEA